MSAFSREELRFDLGDSPLGDVLVATSFRGVAAILIGDSPQALVKELDLRFPSALVAHGGVQPRGVIGRVVQYIAAPRGVLELPLDLCGTAFQVTVWNAVRAIPAGQTSTYAEIAHRIGKPRASRAVGSACARSHHAFAVPCHRVLHSDGSMSWGKACGGHRQRQWLALEENPPRRRKTGSKN